MLKNDDFWKKKLAAFLHDPPTKQFDIKGHEAVAKKNMSTAGIADEEEAASIAEKVKQADIWDSALERFQFPKEKCSHNFKEEPLFFHPLSGEPRAFERVLPADLLEDKINTAIYGVDSNASWREKFFLYWRRWLESASTAENGASIAFLPADSRIPDHSIWVHTSMASAFAGCISEKGNVEAEFLLFQFGPVQDFIAEARTARDLFSGSYLLSWLAAHAMKAVTDAVGPDAIVFPSLRGNGIFDALHKDEIYYRTWASRENTTQTTWDRIREEKGENLASWLLNPTLPNRFFAVVPKGEGETLAKAADKALRDELSSVATAVWDWLTKNGAKEEWKDRFFSQVKAFPQITWAVQEWLPREQALAECEKVNSDVAKRLHSVIDFAEQTIPPEDRDSRYYENKKTLKCDGIMWSAIYALLNAKLAARRNTREFVSSSDPHSKGAVKDSLSGKVDVIGDEEFWNKLKSHPLFGKGSSHRYGAMNLIKRLWCVAKEVPYLAKKIGLEINEVSYMLGFPNYGKIGAFTDVESDDTYFAVIAMDGDEMGKWISGEKAPYLHEVLSPKAKEYVMSLTGGDKLQRTLTPSYHLQFSEALSNFAIYAARSIVKEYGGELIYAGGDDVLAIVSAKKAFSCAQALREAFRQDFVREKIFPGSKCDVSCGIAFGHESAPLQMLVKEAQRMEHVAKNKYERASVAVALYKRSGEIIEWGSKWESNAFDLMEKLCELKAAEKISARFPYALAGLLKPYDLRDGKNEAMLPVIREEVATVVSQQGANLKDEEKADLRAMINQHLETTRDRLSDFLGLFMVETFINRSRENS